MRGTARSSPGADFDAAVDAIERFTGTPVAVEIRGTGSDAVGLAEFSGELRRMGDVDLPEEIADVVGEAAVTFLAGDSTFALWPSRFLGYDSVPYRREWLELRTADAAIRMGPKRPAWAD